MLRSIARRLVRHLGRAPLAEELGAVEADLVLSEVLAARRGAARADPGEPTPTGRLMVELAEMTITLSECLERRGLPEERARELVARTTWSVYRRMGRVASWLARLGGQDSEGRMRGAIRVFRRWPFRPPAYVMFDVEADPGVVAFDVVRCPVAETFRRRSRIELCRASWCDLDYPLARDWSASLERSTTLVEGAKRCDFRWRALGPGTEEVGS